MSKKLISLLVCTILVWAVAGILTSCSNDTQEKSAQTETVKKETPATPKEPAAKPDDKPAAQVKPAAQDKPATEVKTGDSAPTPSESVQTGDDAALVNGKAIPMASFQRELTRLQSQLMRMGHQPNPQQIEALKEKAIENLIRRELLIQAAQKMDIKIDPAEAEAQVQQLTARFKNPEDLKNYLKMMKLTEKDLLDGFSEDLMIQKLIEEKFSDQLEIPDSEVQAYYEDNKQAFVQPEQVQASHILIQVDPKATDEQKAEARKKLEDLKKQIDGGADFAELAKNNSSCPSKEKGGDLGYFQRGQMVPAFEKKAFSLKPGEVSDIVETRFGYHLIKVVDKKTESQIPLEKIAPKVKEYLEGQKLQKVVGEYLKQLNKEADIKILVVTTTLPDTPAGVKPTADKSAPEKPAPSDKPATDKPEPDQSQPASGTEKTSD